MGSPIFSVANSCARKCVESEVESRIISDNALRLSGWLTLVRLLPYSLPYSSSTAVHVPLTSEWVAINADINVSVVVVGEGGCIL